MKVIDCEACMGTGQIEYKTEPYARDCKICKGEEVLLVTDQEIKKLEEQDSSILETLEII